MTDDTKEAERTASEYNEVKQHVIQLLNERLCPFPLQYTPVVSIILGGH